MVVVPCQRVMPRRPAECLAKSHDAWKRRATWDVSLAGWPGASVKQTRRLYWVDKEAASSTAFIGAWRTDVGAVQ